MSDIPISSATIADALLERPVVADRWMLSRLLYDFSVGYCLDAGRMPSLSLSGVAVTAAAPKPSLNSLKSLVLHDPRWTLAAYGRWVTGRLEDVLRGLDTPVPGASRLS